MDAHSMCRLCSVIIAHDQFKFKRISIAVPTPTTACFPSGLIRKSLNFMFTTNMIFPNSSSAGTQRVRTLIKAYD